MTIDPNTLPYVPAGGDGGPRQRTQLIVIHATANTASDEDEARYAQHRPDQSSAHFYNDGDSVIRALPLGDIAFGCLPRGNAISVQFELCGLSDQLTDAVLRRVAPVVAEVARRYAIPVGRPAPEIVRVGGKGIVGHDTVTAAFPEDHGTHTDPGEHFPWSTFFDYVRAALGDGPAPVPPPPVWVTEPAWPGRYLEQPPVMTGSDVRTWQARMSVRGWRLTVDGWYGPESERVCRWFQTEKRLGVDGVVGPVTWRAAWELPIT